MHCFISQSILGAYRNFEEFNFHISDGVQNMKIKLLQIQLVSHVVITSGMVWCDVDSV